MSKTDLQPPSRTSPETHQRGHDKVSRIPVKVEKTQQMPRKPKWIRAKAPTGKGVSRIQKILRERSLSSVCEEANCPNLGECFSHGTATFMIMGDICTPAARSATWPTANQSHWMPTNPSNWPRPSRKCS